jgi:glycosyltransferase involved in cell wall biosynthesis
MALDPARVTAVVPCHAAPPAPALLAAIAAAVGATVVVDDGLSAGEAERLDAIARAAGAGVLRLGANHGKGTAVRQGVERALAHGAPDAVLVMDADGQHPPGAIPAFVAAASAGAELVVGDRLGDAARMPGHRRAGNVMAARAMRALTRRRVADTQCGMRLLRGRALHAVALPPGGFEAETIHLKRCLRAGVAVAWVPIPAIYDGEISAFRHVRDSARIAAALVLR